MHPHIEQLVEQLQWHAGIEGESLDDEYCQSLRPQEILLAARRAGLLIDDARTGITHLRDAKIGDLSGRHAQPLLTRNAFRLFSTALFCAFQEDTTTTAAPDAPNTAAQGAETKIPTKKQPPKRRKVSSTPAAIASGSRNPPDAENMSLQNQGAAVPVDVPNGTPAGKARSTRSSKSFKGKHVLHVAEQASSPHAAEALPMETAPSQPSRRQKRSTISAVASRDVAVKGAAKRTASKVQAPFIQLQPGRTKLLSAVRDAPAGKPAAACTHAATRVAQLANTLAGGTPANAAAAEPQKVCENPNSSVELQQKKKRARKEDAAGAPAATGKASKKSRKGPSTGAQEGQTAPGTTAAAGSKKRGRRKKELDTEEQNKQATLLAEGMPDGTGTSPQGGAAAEEATANDAAADGDTKTPRIVEDSKLPNATESPPPGEVITSRLPPEQLSLLLQVYSFLHETSEVLAIKNVPSLDVLEASLFSTNLSPIKATPTATEPSSQEASAAPYVAVVVPLLQLLATDIYSVVKEQCIEKTGMVAAQERDLAAGHPIVKEENWQHVCSGIFAGVALGQYLSQRDNASHKRFKPAHNLGGLPGTLDPMLWVCFLNGAFTNTPSLRPEVVFLPGADLSESTECLMHWQSAQAVAQAEGIFAGLGDPEIRCGSNGKDDAPVAGDGPTATEFLNRLCSALPESMCNTMFSEGIRIAAAARVGRPRGLLGLFALATADVYNNSTSHTSYTNGNGDQNAGTVTLREEGVAQQDQTALQKVTSDVEDLLGVVQAAEKRNTVPLYGEFVFGQPGVAAALATALEKATLDIQKTPSQADTAAAYQVRKSSKPSTGQCMSEKFRAVISEADLEMARNMETSVDTQQQVQQHVNHDGAERYGAQLDHLAGFESLAHMLNGTSDHEMTPEDWLSILHALVVLASETNSGRAVLRSAHNMDETLRKERFNLKKDIGKIQKQLKESAKTAATKDPKYAQNPSGGAVATVSGGNSKPMHAAQAETIYTRSRGENPRDKLARDREELAAVEKQLLAVQVKLSPHLGQDRQRNEFWCLEVAGDLPTTKQLVVVCQEYSHASSSTRGGPSTSTAKPLLFCEGATAAHPNVGRGRWMLYRSAESLEHLIEWLHSSGERERVLKARLKAVHAAMLALTIVPVQKEAESAANTATGGDTAPTEQKEQKPAVDSLLQTAAGDGAASSPENGADAENVGGNENMTTLTSECEPSTVANSSFPVDPGSPEKLGEFLLAIEQSLQDSAQGAECFLPAWGGERRAKWRSFVAAATGLAQPEATLLVQPNDVDVGQDQEKAAGGSNGEASGGVQGKEQVEVHPRSAMAGVILLEGMVRSPWLRTFWRLWSLPPPLPERVHTWAAVWHRVIALRRALRFDATESHLKVFQFDVEAPRKRKGKQAADLAIVVDALPAAPAKDIAAENDTPLGNQNTIDGVVGPSCNGASGIGGTVQAPEAVNLALIVPQAQTNGNTGRQRSVNINDVAALPGGAMGGTGQ